MDHTFFRGKKIAVVGSGAIGLYYGGLLVDAGYEVHFLLRSDFDTVRQQGIQIQSGGKTISLSNIHAHKTTESIGVCDLVIIALKTTSNSVLETLLPPLLGPSTALLTLQNGLGNEEFLAAKFPGMRVLGGLCFVCLNRIGKGKVEHFGHGTVSLGEFGAPPSSDARAIGGAFIQAGVKLNMVEDLALERWCKLVWNIPFNGLAIAAGNATVDVVLADPVLYAEALALMEEVILGASALGLKIPADYAAFQMRRSENMGAYKASSLIDHLAGRPVEIQSIWGEPLRVARRAGVELPRLALLYALLLRNCPPGSEK